MYKSFSFVAGLGVVLIGAALHPSHVSAMATQFDAHRNPSEPFVMVDQNNAWMQQASQPNMVLVQSPNGGEVLTPGMRSFIRWDSSGHAAHFVHIRYSTDDGATYTTIANGVANTGSYTWHVPNVYAEHAFILVETTDLVTVLASDRTDGDFVLNGQKPTGVSPVTGEIEELTSVEVGDLVQSPSFPTVYAIDGDGTRRPFETPEVLATYDVADDAVVTVTDATLSTIPLGVPMLPKPGVTLVQFPFARTVYAVEGSSSYPILRPIHSEGIAEAMYGEDWKSYVWGLPEHYRNFYHSGSEIVTVFEVDRTMMRPVETRIASI